MDKGKISLDKSPKISKHINKKRQLREHMKTECLNNPHFLICFHEGKRVKCKRLELYCICSKQFFYRKQQSTLLCFIKVSLFSGLFL